MYKTILSYCLNGRKNTVRTKNGRITLLSNVKYAILKKQHLLKGNKLKDC